MARADDETINTWQRHQGYLATEQETTRREILGSDAKKYFAGEDEATPKIFGKPRRRDKKYLAATAKKSLQAKTTKQEIFGSDAKYLVRDHGRRNI